MDPGVSLVQAYLYVNGYFTLTEFPVIFAGSDADEFRSGTDVDVLAVRFPGAHRRIPPIEEGGSPIAYREFDETLDLADDLVDVIIAEVKEGRAELNRGAKDPRVLRAALARVGAFDESDFDALAEELVEQGEVRTENGFRIRLIVFGSYISDRHRDRYRIILLGDILEFFNKEMTKHADAISQMHFKQTALAFLAMGVKARRGPPKPKGGGKG